MVIGNTVGSWVVWVRTICLMRETLGFPKRVDAVYVHDPFYSTMMSFRNADGFPYSVTYESGIDEVPVHLNVCRARKRVTVKV